MLVLDSGFGGLLTVHEVMLSLPRAGLAYVADPASCWPPGNDSSERADRLEEIVLSLQPEAVVISCDALCALELPARLHAKLDAPVIALPERKVAAAWAAHKRHVGVVASGSAHEAGLYDRYSDALPDRLRLTVVGSKDFDRLLFGQEVWDEELDQAIARAVAELLRYEVDLIILGASHAGLARSSFRRYGGVDALQQDVTHTATSALRSFEHLTPPLIFHVSGDPIGFRERASRILQLEISPDQVVPWD